MATAADNVAGPVQEDGVAEEQQYLTFVLARETYAIPILCIREIIEYGRLTEVPMMPDFIRGVINLRGSVVPVIDLARRFAKPASQVTRKSCIVITELPDGDGTQEIGVMVDAVNEVVEIDEDNIEPAPSFGTRIRTDFISGMGKLNDEFVVILETANVLSMEEMAMLADMSAAQGSAASGAKESAGETANAEVERH